MVTTAIKQEAPLSQRDWVIFRVCHQLASIAQYLKCIFKIIIYFGFRLSSAYNSILFCCLRGNVEPCCHTHDSRPLSLCISRDRTWSLLLYTVTDDHDCIQRMALSCPIHAAIKNTVAKCDKLTGAALTDHKARYLLRIEHLVYPTCIWRPRNIVVRFGRQKLEWFGYPIVKNRIHKCDRWTDRHTDAHCMTTVAALMHSIVRQQKLKLF